MHKQIGKTVGAFLRASAFRIKGLRREINLI